MGAGRPAWLSPTTTGRLDHSNDLLLQRILRPPLLGRPASPGQKYGRFLLIPLLLSVLLAPADVHPQYLPVLVP